MDEVIPTDPVKTNVEDKDTILLNVPEQPHFVEQTVVTADQDINHVHLTLLGQIVDIIVQQDPKHAVVIDY